MKLRTIGLALAVTCLVAAGGPALAQTEALPPGIPMPVPGGPMPSQGPMVPGQMPPGSYAPMPNGYAPMPGGPAMGGYPGSMMGGYPGMAPVMPYPPPLAGDGCMPCGCCDAAGCDGCCGDSGFGSHGGCCDEGSCCEGDGTAHWRARFETLLMGFKLPQQPANLTTGPTGDLGGIQNLEFDRELGARLSLEAKLPNGHSLEVVFLGFMHWNDNQAIVDPTGALQSPYQTFAGTNVVPYDNASEHSYDYTSDLLTVEFNYWAPAIQHNCFQASFGAGVRFVHVGDEFIYDAVSGAALGTTDIHADNNMPALQVGMMFCVPLAKHVSARFDAKSGIGYNFGSQSTDIATVGVAAGDTVYHEHADTGKGAFLGEFSLVFTWQVNCYVAVYGGYQALWLDELVLAPDNFNSTFPTGGFRPVLIDDTADRFYQSALCGVELTW